MNEQKLIVVELHELQPILSQTFGDELIVVRFTTKNLLPPGENYGSTILSVHAVIKRDKNAAEEDLYLVAKMPPPTEFQRLIFDSAYTFRKEIFMYEDIIPYYNQLEKEIGLKEDELFDVLPKYYKSRLSLTPDVGFDDNAVILMENLSMRGYYIGDRTKGCDLEHSKVTIQAMARFHALGMVTKYKKPEYFEILKKRSKSVDIKADEFSNVSQKMLQRMEADPEISVYMDRINNALGDIETSWKVLIEVPVEPWSTIVHSDFWVNNIMFHRDKNGQVDDVKFVDFQNYLFFSPMRELVFYLFSSTDDDVYDNHIEELITLYHETLLAVLDRMGCDTTPFRREEFDAKLPKDANAELLHLCFMVKVLTLDVQETQFDYDKIKSVMTTYEGNQNYIKRLRKIILSFAKRNWI